MLTDDEDSEMSAEELKEVDEARAESPVLRKSLPIVTDIEYLADEETQELLEEDDMEEK